MIQKLADLWRRAGLHISSSAIVFAFATSPKTDLNNGLEKMFPLGLTRELSMLIISDFYLVDTDQDGTARSVSLSLSSQGPETSRLSSPFELWTASCVKRVQGPFLAFRTSTYNTSPPMKVWVGNRSSEPREALLCTFCKARTENEKWIQRHEVNTVEHLSNLRTQWDENVGVSSQEFLGGNNAKPLRGSRSSGMLWRVEVGFSYLGLSELPPMKQFVISFTISHFSYQTTTSNKRHYM